MRRRMLAIFVLLCLFSVSAFAETDGVVVDLINHPDASWSFQEGAEILEIVFPPVQGADACILRLGDRVLLVDAATPGQHDRVAAALAYMGITHVDTGFNTHPHDDHIGGFEVLTDAVTLGELVITFPEDTNNAMINALRVMREQNVPVTHAQNGDLLPFGDVRIEVIQSDTFWFNENCRSAMLRVEYGERSLLLAADVGTDRQNELLEQSPEKLPADIFKYPHHAVDPAGWRFLKTIGGEMTVITNSRSRVKDADKDARWRGLTPVYTCYGMVRLRTDGHIWVADQIRLDVD